MAATKPGVRCLPARVSAQTGNVEFLAWHGPFKPETYSFWLGGTFQARNLQFLAWDFGRTLATQEKQCTRLHAALQARYAGACLTSNARQKVQPATLQARNLQFLAWQDLSSQKLTVSGLARPFKPETYSFWLGRDLSSQKLTVSGFAMWRARVREWFQTVIEGHDGVPGLARPFKPETYSFWLGRTFQARNLQFLA